MESPSDRIFTLSVSAADAGTAETVPSAKEESPVAAAKHAASPFFILYIRSSLSMNVPFLGKVYRIISHFLLFLVYNYHRKKSSLS